MALMDKLYFGKTSSWKKISAEEFEKIILLDFLNYSDKFIFHSMGPSGFMATIAGPLGSSLSYNQNRQDVLNELENYFHPKNNKHPEFILYRDSIDNQSMSICVDSGFPSRIDIVKNKPVLLSWMYQKIYPYGKKNILK